MSRGYEVAVESWSPGFSTLRRRAQHVNSILQIEDECAFCTVDNKQATESRVQSPESRVQSPESRVQSPESRVQFVFFS